MNHSLGDLLVVKMHPTNLSSSSGYLNRPDVGKLVALWGNYYIVEIMGGWLYEPSRHSYLFNPSALLEGHPNGHSRYWAFPSHHIMENLGPTGQTEPKQIQQTQTASISDLGKFLSSANQYSVGPNGETNGPSGLKFL